MKINTEPLVSVIVRTCNRPSLLNRALGSILDQTYPHVETVLVDDGKYGIHIAALEGLSDGLNLHYVRTDRAGRSRAANEGIKKAEGRFVIFLDDDDELYPQHLTRLVQGVLEKEMIAYSDCEMCFEEYDAVHDMFSTRNRFVQFSFDFSRDLMLLRNYIPIMCLCLPKDMLEKAQGFDESIDLFEDWDLLIRLSRMTDFHHIPEVTAKYRIWGKAQKTQATTDTQNAYQKVASKYMNHLTPAVLYDFFQFTESLLGTKNTLARRLSECEAEGVRKDEEIRSLRETKDEETRSLRETKDEEIRSLHETKDEEIRSLHEIASGKNEEILDLSAQASRREEQLKTVEKEASALIRENRRLSQENEALLAANRMYIEENLRKEAYIAKLRQRTRQKEHPDN